MEKFTYFVSFVVLEHTVETLWFGVWGSTPGDGFITLDEPVVGQEDHPRIIDALLDQLDWNSDRWDDMGVPKPHMLALTGFNLVHYEHRKFYDSRKVARQRAKEVAEGNEFWWREPKK